MFHLLVIVWALTDRECIVVDSGSIPMVGDVNDADTKDMCVDARSELWR